MEKEFLNILLAFLLGAVVGYEREAKEKPAGLRTHMLVSMASALIAMLSSEAFPGADPARLIAGMLAGIGFLGAGTIIKLGNSIVGLTTAASLLMAAAIGIACGTGFYTLAVFATFLTYLTLELKYLVSRRSRGA